MTVPNVECQMSELVAKVWRLHRRQFYRYSHRLTSWNGIFLFEKYFAEKYLMTALDTFLLDILEWHFSFFSTKKSKSALTDIIFSSTTWILFLGVLSHARSSLGPLTDNKLSGETKLRLYWNYNKIMPFTGELQQNYNPLKIH